MARRNSPQGAVSDRVVQNTRLTLSGLTFAVTFLIFCNQGATLFAVWKHNSILSQDASLEHSSLERQNKVAEEDTTNIVPISCPSLARQFASTGDWDGLSDPNFSFQNKSLHSRETVTDPSFLISVHGKEFDKLRWVHIMGKGDYYETGITNMFKQLLNGKAPGIVIDVGQNIGWFSLYSRAMGHSVISFEPNPLNHLRLCESLGLNSWDTDGTMVQIQGGLSDKQGIDGDVLFHPSCIQYDVLSVQATNACTF